MAPRPIDCLSVMRYVIKKLVSGKTSVGIAAVVARMADPIRRSGGIMSQ